MMVQELSTTETAVPEECRPRQETAGSKMKRFLEAGKKESVFRFVFNVVILALSLCVIISLGSSPMPMSGFPWYTGIVGISLTSLQLILRTKAVLLANFTPWAHLFIACLLSVLYLVLAAICSANAAKFVRVPLGDEVVNCYASAAFFSWLATIVCLAATAFMLFTHFIAQKQQTREEMAQRA